MPELLSTFNEMESFPDTGTLYNDLFLLEEVEVEEEEEITGEEVEMFEMCNNSLKKDN
jgi:hypothetical protein